MSSCQHIACLLCICEFQVYSITIFMRALKKAFRNFREQASLGALDFFRVLFGHLSFLGTLSQKSLGTLMDYILNNLKNVSQLRSNCEVLKLFIHTFVHIGQKKTEVTIIKFLRLFDKCAMSTSENLMKD